MMRRRRRDITAFQQKLQLMSPTVIRIQAAIYNMSKTPRYSDGFSFQPARSVVMREGNHHRVQ